MAGLQWRRKDLGIYEEACNSCERRVVVRSAADKAALLDCLGNSCTLARNLDSLNLVKGDRLVPCELHWDIFLDWQSGLSFRAIILAAQPSSYGEEPKPLVCTWYVFGA